ncbi:NrdD-like anaerobic ribonucleotide reductase large subunit [Salmonella phage Sepoy]|uniref:Anaerobic ribonucleoside-triphosphate reductase n=1 Tax=Salmonella phage Sepoy TaxID=2565517 RepID=A0A4P8NNB1_9CAUD|nr:NrdD-like anaerobic ribonucleotide reductase large subunit [Salmonella phage Sepoy]QCQ65616.1 anaerobic ribonucleoside-triphosphate reductase [Salmonella phage Sepoy]
MNRNEELKYKGMQSLIRNCKEIIEGSADEELLFNNANKPSERFPTQRDMLAGELSKYLILEEMPIQIRNAHMIGDIHFHDADYAALGMTNCCLVALEDMLKNGMKVGNAEISTPNSITTAAAITAQIITQVSSHQYGGTSVDRLDEVLAPYVRKSYDKNHAFAKRWTKDEAKASVMATEMTEKEVYDACQGLEYEINTMFNSNGQSPFITFGFGLGTSWEARLVQKAILEVRMDGLGINKRTAIFPKLVFVLREGVNMKPGDVNYDIKKLAMKCTAERMYPDYISYDKVVEVTGDYKVSMGCRSFLAAAEDGETSGRNNLGVVSVNLPRIAIEAEGNIDLFFDLLELRVDTALKALEWRVDRLKYIQAKAAPILYMSGAFGLRLGPDEYVFDHFYKRASVSLGYSLYATPSESLCDRFCRLDREYFPEHEDILAKGYYTNSHHLDVERKVAPNVKFDYESNFTPIASGGCISYVELPDMKRFPDALEWVINYAASKVHYFGINTPVDSCGECGFLGETIASEDGFKCPICGNHDPETLEVTRRVCGYLGNPGARPFNPGKQHEVMGRVKHQDIRAK